MIVLLGSTAERQLRELPPPAARKVLEALRVLAGVPHSGIALPDESPFSGLMVKVVRVRRGWSYRVLYEICPRWLFVHAIAPSWLAR